ncbi:MAG: hypothetical protein KH339_10120 [Firmicutes bacterium]|nr:hypothetical protein [Bacillota bacterium]
MGLVGHALEADDVLVGGDVYLTLEVIAGIVVDGGAADGDEGGAGARLTFIGEKTCGYLLKLLSKVVTSH